MQGLSRRSVIIGGALLASACAPPSPTARRIALIEDKIGGRIGVAAVDTATNAGFAYRADERFAMCSTFKASLVAAVLSRAEAGQISLTERLNYGETDMLPTSPQTEAHVAEGALSVEALCQAAIEVSDNTAANLLLRRIGGPAALTMFFRKIGDQTSRLDRSEMALNANAPGDPRDTTSPAAMLRNLQLYLLTQKTINLHSRERLKGWMLNEQNGRNRIRAGAPAAWEVANKPGTGANGAVNDIAMLWPPDRAPIAISIYTNAPAATVDQSAAAIAATAREAIAHLL